MIWSWQCPIYCGDGSSSLDCSIVPTCAAWGSAKWDYQRPLKTVGIPTVRHQPAGPIMPFKRKFQIVCCMGAWQLSWAWLCHWNRSDLIKPLDGWLFRIGWLCPAWNFRKFLHDIVWFSSPLQIDIAFVMVTTDHRLTSRWPESILWSGTGLTTLTGQKPYSGVVTRETACLYIS